MRVIFLDHDGVICLAQQFGGRFKKRKKYVKEHGPTEREDIPFSFKVDNFDKKAIKILNEILEKTDAEIVVSSDWKRHGTLNEMGDYYEEQGIIKKPIAFTPDHSSFDPNFAGLCSWKGWLEQSRAIEIKKWLDDNEVTHWVAIDDLPMGMPTEWNPHGWELENFVHTPRVGEGIKQSGIKEKVLSFLE